MTLPMDNIFFRYLLQCWPVILAVIITVILIYKWKHPKITAEKLQKGLIKQSVLLVAETNQNFSEDEELQEWVATRQKLKSYFENTNKVDPNPREPINYRSYITVSLLWILFWTGTLIFISIRILLNPYYYGNEAIFLGYFVYYIIIGLISYFRK
jgi:hypothetical protein